MNGTDQNFFVLVKSWSEITILGSQDLFFFFGFVAAMPLLLDRYKERR